MKQYSPIFVLFILILFTSVHAQEYRRSQHPNYSPNGKMIVFSATISKGSNDLSKGISVMSSDGTGVKSVTPNAPGVFDEYPTISRDGKIVAFLRRSDSTKSDVFVVNVDGSGLKRLTNTAERELRPEFNHDGTGVMFVRDYSPSFMVPYGSLVMVNLATKAETQLLGREYQVTHAIPAPRGLFFVAAAKLDAVGKPTDIRKAGNTITLVSPNGEFSPKSPVQLPADGYVRIDRIQTAIGPDFLIYAEGEGSFPNRAYLLITAKGVEKLETRSGEFSLSPDGTKLMSWENGESVYVKGLREQRGIVVGKK